MAQTLKIRASELTILRHSENFLLKLFTSQNDEWERVTGLLEGFQKKSLNLQDMYKEMETLVNGDGKLITDINKVLPISHRFQPKGKIGTLKKKKMVEFFHVIQKECPEKYELYMAFLKKMREEGKGDNIREYWITESKVILADDPKRLEVALSLIEYA